MRNEEFLKQASFFLNFPTANEEVHWESVELPINKYNINQREWPHWESPPEWFNFNVDSKGRRLYTYETGYPSNRRADQKQILTGVMAQGGNGYDDFSPFNIYFGYGWEGFLLYNECQDVIASVVEDKFWSKLKRQKGRGMYYDSAGNEILMPGWWIGKWRYGRNGDGNTVTTKPTKWNPKDDYLIYLIYIPSSDEREQKIHFLRISDKFGLVDSRDIGKPTLVDRQVGYWPPTSGYKLSGMKGITNAGLDDLKKQWVWTEEETAGWTRRQQYNKIKSNKMRKEGASVWAEDHASWRNPDVPNWWQDELCVNNAPAGQKIWYFQDHRMGSQSLNPYTRYKQRRFYRFFNSVSKIPDMPPEWVVNTKSRKVKLSDYYRLEKLPETCTQGGGRLFLLDENLKPTHQLLKEGQYYHTGWTALNNLYTRDLSDRDDLLNVNYFNMDSGEWEASGDHLLEITSSLLKNKLVPSGQVTYLGPNLQGKKVEEVVLSKTKYSGEVPVKFAALINWNVRLPKVVRDWNLS